MDTIYGLAGTIVETGFSVDPGISVGGEFTTGDGYIGININIGLGMAGNPELLTPVELHSIVEQAWVSGMTFDELVEYIKQLIEDLLKEKEEKEEEGTCP